MDSTLGLIEVMEAYLRGEKIEFRIREHLAINSHDRTWKELQGPMWNSEVNEYRIAPKSSDEILEEVLKTIKEEKIVDRSTSFSRGYNSALQTIYEKIKKLKPNA